MKSKGLLAPEDELATKVTVFLGREDGSEARIIAETFDNIGGKRSTAIMVHKRASSDQPWDLCTNDMHPDWRSMSVEEYKQRGRSAMWRTVTFAEVAKVVEMLGRPLKDLYDQVLAVPPESSASSEDDLQEGVDMIGGRDLERMRG